MLLKMVTEIMLLKMVTEIMLLKMVTERIPPVLLRPDNDAGADRIQIDIG
jgi:hypothetical protein